MNRNDAEALPLLLEVMAAAGRHDQTECLRLLTAAEAHLPAGVHKSKADLVTARDAVAAGDWKKVWAAAHWAMCGLTWAFPPDPAVCPPIPGEDPFAPPGSSCAGCGYVLPGPARFCPGCGAPIA